MKSKFRGLRMRPEPPPVDPEDDGELFRASIGAVRPLNRTSAPLPAVSKPMPEARQLELDEAAVRDELLDNVFDPGLIEVGDEIHHLKAGQSPRLLKRLRRGHFSIQAEIDLHQMTVAVARDAVVAFLAEAIRHREFCVRIVHGKGLRSSSRGPVVKRMVEQVLRRRDDVLAFASALPAQGGTGAVLVLLKGD